MGKGVINLLLSKEIIKKVYWKGRAIERVNESIEDIKKNLEKNKRLNEEKKQKYLEKIIPINNYTDISAKVSIFIETVKENMATKKHIFNEISSLEYNDAILASNTSSLSITELASEVVNPERVVGLHFFNPAPIMKLTEVIVGLNTSEETVKKILDFSTKIGKVPVVVNEAPGFIVNRMLIPLINEAIGILSEGVASAEDIDIAMRYGANHPIGPLKLADLIGNDINLAIMETMFKETGDPKYRPHPLLRKMVRGKLLGRKTSIGFFKYKKFTKND